MIETPLPIDNTPALVDELGDIERKVLAPHKHAIARAEEIRRELRKRHDWAPATQTFALEGVRYTVVLGVRTFETVVYKAKCLKLLGAAKLRQISTPTLKALRQVLTDEQIGRVTGQEQTGYRTLLVASKEQP